MFRTLRKDIAAVFQRDPAARNIAEVLICYPGLHAITLHRLSHWLWNHRLKLVGRMLSHVGRFLTGIEIHPGAKIASGFFIDHGMGVVIGETTEIGENVTLYQGVTLGGTSLKKEKRHPTLRNGVVVGAGAMVLGAIEIGENSKIGSGSVAIKDVPPDSTVVGVPGRVVLRSKQRPETGEVDVDWHLLPDPVARAVGCILEKISLMEKELEQLRQVREEERRVETVEPRTLSK